MTESAPGGPSGPPPGTAGAPAPEPILALAGIVKRYPGVVALKGVDFDVRPGEVHVLLGENGAGKSTLIKIIAGAVARDEGTILFDGTPVGAATPALFRRLGISVIYQELSLVPQLDVTANVFLGRERTRAGPLGRALGLKDRTAMEAHCRALFAELGLAIDPRAEARSLSVSEMQLVEIVRAVAFNARVILMDEPTTALGVPEKERLFGLVAQLKNRGIGIVYVSHILEDCLAIGDRITVLRDGAKVAALARSEATVDGLVHLMTGRSFTERYPRIASSAGAPALSVRNLGRAGYFSDVSFDLHAGEILGLGGLVGAGRTSLVRAIFGLDPVDSGTIVLGGTALARPTPRRAIRAGVALLTEDRKHLGILGKLSVAQNTIVTAANLGGTDLARRYVAGRQFLRGGAIRQETDGMIRRLAIKTASQRTPAAHLSGGNQQKVLLARALLAESRILILDEPTKGIDAGAKIEIYRLLEELAGQGAAILVISSEWPELGAICRRILLMHAGRVTAEVERGEVDDAELARLATTGAAYDRQRRTEREGATP